MLTNQEISEGLINLPKEIATAEELVEDTRHTYEKAALQLKATEAKAKLELKADNLKKKKLSDKQIDHQIDQDCLSERIALLTMESKYKKAKANMSRLIREHDSMKALAYLKQREMKSGID